ncbi:MarR family winged helix-turn-helix transcriptional regulator [Maritimibacter alexandrii]|uniref:MarR family winged helix-turn-helix transcriptional regulator n=1 Tax=Maritimibacter alexandrii TaxID=2570355 RepID=UPI0011080F71|nr:MarR family transcriptional regulator [Maritimibacter alexandrii]
MNDDDAFDRAGLPNAEWPFFWITKTAHRYTHVMEARLKTIGVDPTYWRVMTALDEGKRLSVSEISAQCILKPNTATKIVHRMLAEGLVETGERAGDARVTEVMLTGKGDALAAKARVVADEVYAQAFAGLSQDERLVLDMLLERVFNRLG